MIRGSLVLLLALGACSGSTAEDLVPGATEVTSGPVLRAGYDLAATADGWAAVWGEVPADESGTILHFVELDGAGEMLDAPRTIGTIPDLRWPRLHLVTTPSGYDVWHVQSYRRVGVIVLDQNGEELSREETDVMLDWRTNTVAVAAIGDAVLLASRPQGGSVQFRIYNDQGLARTDHVSLGSGGDLDVLTRTDRFEVYFNDTQRVLRAVISTAGDVITPAEVVSTDPDSGTWSMSVTRVGEDDTFMGWTRRAGFGDGTLYHYLPGWPEPRTLHPANRRESFDGCIGAAGGRVFVARQSDVEHAVPQLVVGSLDPGAGELSLREEEPLTRSGVRAGGCDFEAGPMGLAVLFSGEVDGQSRIFFKRVAE
jgi:hypothetical protein